MAQPTISAEPEGLEALPAAAPQGKSKSYHRLRNASREARDPEAQYRDRDRMRRLISELAANGDAESQYLMGNYYAKGEGTFEQDDVKAVNWYVHAANQQHPRATFRLAAHVLYGRGVEQDLQSGLELTEKAARLGDVDAMTALAAMIETGEGPVDDPEAAMDWYRKAADAGRRRGVAD